MLFIERSNLLLFYGLAIIAIAIIAVVLLEVIKFIVPLKVLFHRALLRRWLNAFSNQALYNEFLMLVQGSSGFPFFFYAQSTYKLMGQVQSAATTALDFPDKYELFYKFLTVSKFNEKHIDTPTNDESDSVIWNLLVISPNSQQYANNPDEVFVQKATQARARLDHLIARKLDAFQISAEYKWSLLNQAAAFVIGFLISSYISRLGELYLEQRVLLAILAGAIAPFLKDFSKTLSRYRNNRL